MASQIYKTKVLKNNFSLFQKNALNHKSISFGLQPWSKFNQPRKKLASLTECFWHQAIRSDSIFFFRSSSGSEARRRWPGLQLLELTFCFGLLRSCWTGSISEISGSNLNSEFRRFPTLRRGVSGRVAAAAGVQVRRVRPIFVEAQEPENKHKNIY